MKVVLESARQSEEGVPRVGRPPTRTVIRAQWSGLGLRDTQRPPPCLDRGALRGLVILASAGPDCWILRPTSIEFARFPVRIVSFWLQQHR